MLYIFLEVKSLRWGKFPESFGGKRVFASDFHTYVVCVRSFHILYIISRHENFVLCNIKVNKVVFFACK